MSAVFFILRFTNELRASIALSVQCVAMLGGDDSLLL